MKQSNHEKDIAEMITFENCNRVAKEMIKYDRNTAKAFYYEFLWQLGKLENDTVTQASHKTASAG